MSRYRKSMRQKSNILSWLKKNLSENQEQRELPQLGKEHLPKNATATIIFNGEKLEGQQQGEGVPSHLSFSTWYQKFWLINKTRIRMKGVQIGKEEKTCLCKQKTGPSMQKF